MSERNPSKPREWLRRPAAVSLACAVPLLAVCVPLAACKRDGDRISAAPVSNPLAAQLAGARYDAAQAHLSRNEPDKALLLLVSSLRADPAFTDSIRAVRDLLAGTRWRYPAVTIDTGMPIASAILSGGNLWTTLTEDEGFTTTVRWNLGTLAAESVLFPRRGETTTSFLLTPDANRAVVTRTDGRHSTTLLCDALTLRPVRTLTDGVTDPAFPGFVRFSPDSLLFAHAEPGAATSVWHIRDLATGEILRSHVVSAEPAPVGATLDRERLVVRLADSSRILIPVSPVGEVTTDRASSPADSPPPPAGFVIRGNGIEISRFLCLPKTTGRGSGPLSFNPDHVLGLTHLAQALTGLRFDEESREFVPLEEAERRSIVAFAHHADEFLDGLDFTPVVKDLTSVPFRASTPAGSFPVRDRIARAQPPASGFLALRSAAAAPLDPTAEMTAVFAEGDHAAILAAIRSAVPHGPASARGLLLALTAGDPETIRASLERNPGLPHTLEKLAASRLAWVEHRQPQAIALWTDGYPDIAAALRTEDWNGWEGAGFASLFEAHFAEMRSELASFDVPENPSSEQQRSLSARLLDPETTRAIGKARHAAACLEAARTGSGSAAETETTLSLLTLARALGAPPAECLRVEATAHMASGNFPRAHECWISLITDFPQDTHQPMDYAEAAYTAFETGDEEQAMAILGTGVTRFRDSPDFAYRAGWISLLTGRFMEAYEFLLVGERRGYPADRLEKATAMLVIASAESGSTADASRFSDRLLSLDPSWAEPEPPKAESWPPEFKTILQSVTNPPRAMPLDEPEDGSPLPENPPPDDLREMLENTPLVPDVPADAVPLPE